MRHTKKGKNGETFYSDQKYVRKIGTDQVFVYAPELMQRGDMQWYDPFVSTGDGQTPRKDPSMDPAEYHSQRFAKEFGIDRATVRENLKKYKVKSHKLFYALTILWDLEPIHDLNIFKPAYGQVAKITGPTFTQEDLDVALTVFRKNQNLEYLTSEAANDLITDAQLGVEPAGRHSGAVPVE